MQELKGKSSTARAQQQELKGKSKSLRTIKKICLMVLMMSWLSGE